MNRNNQTRRSSLTKRPRSTRRPFSRPSRRPQKLSPKPNETLNSPRFTRQPSKVFPPFTTLPGSKVIPNTKEIFSQTTNAKEILTDRSLQNIPQQISAIFGRTTKPRRLTAGVSMPQDVPNANTLNESLLVVVLLSVLFVCAAIVIVTALILRRRKRRAATILEESRGRSVENNYRFIRRQTSRIYETVAPPLPVRFSGESHLNSIPSFETVLPNPSKDDYYVTPNIAFKQSSFLTSFSSPGSPKESAQKDETSKPATSENADKLYLEPMKKSTITSIPTDENNYMTLADEH